MDDDSDCELVHVKVFFCFPKTSMGTASINHALENEGIYILYIDNCFLSYYQEHKLAGASRSQRVQMLASGYRY